ncbi:MAG: aspartate carbamoyltransferase [Chlamydiae bacterium]|nr:aspartate carbamoyltransferase [Chlamydiota bacterium]
MFKRGEKRGLLSVKNLSRDEIEAICELAKKFAHTPDGKLCDGFILASCFFDPSTRTRLSFEAAMLRLGGKVIGFADSHSTSAKKGESLRDTMRVVSSYVDVIVIRHPEALSADIAAEASDKPVINAGDGANEHPSQTLVDLFTMQKLFGRIDGLKIAFVGDLKYGRTVHSLARALALYSAELYFVGMSSLGLPGSVREFLEEKHVSFSFHDSLEEILGKVDVVYMTRLQKERLQGEDVEDGYGLKQSMLKHAKPDLKILHPLPRLDEIEASIDSTPFAAYFQQAENGVPVRMAILACLLGKAGAT